MVKKFLDPVTVIGPPQECTASTELTVVPLSRSRKSTFWVEVIKPSCSSRFLPRTFPKSSVALAPALAVVNSATMAHGKTRNI